MNSRGTFHNNLSTKYRYIVSREIWITDVVTEDLETHCLHRGFFAGGRIN